MYVYFIVRIFSKLSDLFIKYSYKHFYGIKYVRSLNRECLIIKCWIIRSLLCSKIKMPCFSSVELETVLFMFCFYFSVICKLCILYILYIFQVSVKTDMKDTKPGGLVSVSVETKPNAVVGLLGIDQSVLLLKSGNDITQNDVSALWIFCLLCIQFNLNICFIMLILDEVP